MSQPESVTAASAWCPGEYLSPGYNLSSHPSANIILTRGLPSLGTRTRLENEGSSTTQSNTATKPGLLALQQSRVRCSSRKPSSFLGHQKTNTHNKHGKGHRVEGWAWLEEFTLEFTAQWQNLTLTAFTALHFPAGIVSKPNTDTNL